MATNTVKRGTTTLQSPNGGDTVLLAGGSAAIDGNLDWSSVTGMALLEIGGEYNGQFASESGPLKARIDKCVYAAAGGDFWWSSQGSGSDTTALAWILGGGHMHLVEDGVWTRLEMRAGQLTVANACAVTTLRCKGGYFRLKDGESSVDPTLLVMAGGGGKLHRGATTVRHIAGELEVIAGANAIGTLDVFGPGLKLVESSAITTANFERGVPDVSDLVLPCDIATLNIDMTLPGANAFLDNPRIGLTTVNRLYSDGRV